MLHQLFRHLLATTAGLLVITGVIDLEFAAAQQAPRAGAPSRQNGTADQILEPVTRWFERASREYQETVVKQLSVPTGKGVPLPESRQSSQIAAQPAPAEPTLVDQIKGLLGIETAKGPQPAEPDKVKAAQKAASDEMIRKQVVARALEQQRLAEEQRLSTEARKAKEAIDLATEQRQKAAEVARLEEERRKAGKPAQEPAKEPTKSAVAAAEDEQRKLAAQKQADDARRASERKEAERKEAERRDTERKAAEAKAAAEQRARQAALEEIKRQGEATKPPEPVRPQPAQDLASAQPKPKDDTPGGKDRPAAEAERAAPVADKASAARLAEAASRAATKALQRGDRASRSRSDVAAVATGHRHKPKNTCARAGAGVSPPATYVVKRGDTLWAISRRHYDKGSKYEKIMRANEAKIDSPDLIFPCQKFFLPGRTALFWVLHRQMLADAS